MAIITSIKSGNWSDETVWSAGTSPATGDAITIAAGHTVVLDAEFICTGAVTLNGSLDLTQALTIGSGTNLSSGTAGTFAFGAGGRLLGVSALKINRGTMQSQATASQWARVEGSVSISGTSPDNAAAAVQYAMHHVAFTTTGALVFPSRGGGTFAFSNCTFAGSNSVTFGTSGWTDGTAALKIEACDFRKCGKVAFIPSVKTGDAERFIRKCTFSADVMSSIQFKDSPAISECVFVNYVETPGATVPAIYEKTFHALTGNAPSGAISVTSAVNGSVLRNAYVYAPPEALNPRMVTIESVVGGVIEAESGNEPNMHMGGFPAQRTEGVLALGYGDLGNRVGAKTQDWTIINCTRVTPASSPINSIWLSENGTLTPLTTGLKLRNNLHVCLGQTPDPYMCRTNAAQYVETLDLDYNCKWNVTDFLQAGRFVNTNAGEHNLSLDPQFTDPTRAFVSWTRKRTGNPSASYTDGYTYLLNINGYDASGVQIPDVATGATVEELVTWVRDGYRPKNQALKEAGEGGTFVGALAVGTAPPDPPGPNGGPLTWQGLSYGCPLTWQGLSWG